MYDTKCIMFVSFLLFSTALLNLGLFAGKKLNKGFMGFFLFLFFNVNFSSVGRGSWTLASSILVVCLIFAVFDCFTESRSFCR